jgi:hypothetical protein
MDEEGLGINFGHLRSAVDWSIQQLATPKQKRLDAIKQYVGNHYAEKGSDKVVPTNFLELALTIYVQQLAAKAPAAHVTTQIERLKPWALSTELALNQLPDELKLSSTLRRCVIEALFSFAVVKIGLCSSGELYQGHDLGKPFVDLVSLDNYFCDMSAKSRAAIDFEGNDYWVTQAEAKAMFGKNDIEADPFTITGPSGEEKAEGISTDEGATLYQEKVWLRDVWLPRENVVLTYGVTSKKIFRVVKWDGPEGGPYRMLGFSDVPDNLLPLPPVALWRDLHELGNTLFRKLGRQADAKKTVAAFSGGNNEDVEALRRAADGDGIRYTGQKPEQITVGGIDNSTLAFYLQVRDLFSYFAGNIDALGGLSPSSDTLGQDQMVSEAANSRISYMRDCTTAFVSDIFKTLAWYIWTDPVRERKVYKKVKGLDLSLPVVWSAETREGDWLDYNFDIDAFSMRSDSPETKMQKIGLVIERYVTPMMPLLQAQGGSIDFKSLMSLISRLSNLPELLDIIRFDEPLVVAPTEEGVSMPSTTTRRYERIGRPGATRSGKDDVMSRLLMGSKVQGSESASLSRSIS